MRRPSRIAANFAQEEQRKLETFSKEVRSPNEECTRVPFKSLLQLAGVRISAIVVEIVVVADVKGLARARRPAEQHLAREVLIQRIVVDPKSRKDKSRKLVS